MTSSPIRVIELDIAGVRARACEIEAPSGALVTFDFVGLFESMGVTRQSINRRASAYEQAGKLTRTVTVLVDPCGRAREHQTVTAEGLLVLLMGASPERVNPAARPALTALQAGALAVVMDAIRRGDARVCLPLASLLGEAPPALPPPPAHVTIGGVEYPAGTTMADVVRFMDASTRRFAAETLRIRETRLAAREARLAAPKAKPTPALPPPKRAPSPKPPRPTNVRQLRMFTGPDPKGIPTRDEIPNLTKPFWDGVNGPEREKNDTK